MKTIATAQVSLRPRRRESGALAARTAPANTIPAKASISTGAIFQRKSASTRIAIVTTTRWEYSARLAGGVAIGMPIRQESPRAVRVSSRPMLARTVRHAFPFFLLLVANALAQAPQFRLPDTAAPERYEVHLALDPREPAFTGTVTIAANVKRAAGILWLNATALSIDRVEARQGSREVKVEVVPGGEDFVGLRGAFEPGPARLVIAYRGKVDALLVEGIFRQQERGEWYLLTQFQAIGARRAFPCFDEPAMEDAVAASRSTPPRADVVVANTPEAGTEVRRGARRLAAPSLRRRREPLPSYLVAFAVGPFDVVDGGVAGKKSTPLRYLTPKGRGEEARYARESTPRLLEMLEDYFGTPYPYEKLDSIAIPHIVTFGAMENAGLITYGAQFMLARRRTRRPTRSATATPASPRTRSRTCGSATS